MCIRDRSNLKNLSFFPERDTVKHPKSSEFRNNDIKVKSHSFSNLKIINNIDDEIKNEMTKDKINKRTLERYKTKQIDEDKSELNDNFFNSNINKSNSVNKKRMPKYPWDHNRIKKIQNKPELVKNLSKKDGTVNLFKFMKKKSLKRKNIGTNFLANSRTKKTNTQRTNKNKLKEDDSKKYNSQILGWTYNNLINKSDSKSNPNSKSVSSGNSDIINPAFYQRIKNDFKLKNNESNNCLLYTSPSPRD